jgi:hypothetical protein
MKVAAMKARVQRTLETMRMPEKETELYGKMRCLVQHAFSIGRPARSSLGQKMVVGRAMCVFV